MLRDVWRQHHRSVSWLSNMLGCNMLGGYMSVLSRC